MRKVILYIAQSIDGFIEDSDGAIDFLDCVAKEGEDYGYEEFNKTIDTIIVGRKTYQKVLQMGFPYHPDKKKVYVISRQKKEDFDNVCFFNGNITELVEQLKTNPGKNIYCDGGAEIVRLLLKNNLIDEIILSIIPTILGTGKRLFEEISVKSNFITAKTQTFDTGLIQIHWIKK